MPVAGSARLEDLGRLPLPAALKGTWKHCTSVVAVGEVAGPVEVENGSVAVEAQTRDCAVLQRAGTMARVLSRWDSAMAQWRCLATAAGQWVIAVGQWVIAVGHWVTLATSSSRS